MEDNQIRRQHVKTNVGEYAGILERACPAQVYEYVDDETRQGEGGERYGGKKLAINSQVMKNAPIAACTLGAYANAFRTVSIASCAISRSQRRTLLGQYLKVAEVRSTVRIFSLSGATELNLAASHHMIHPFAYDSLTWRAHRQAPINFWGTNNGCALRTAVAIE